MHVLYLYLYRNASTFLTNFEPIFNEFSDCAIIVSIPAPRGEFLDGIAYRKGVMSGLGKLHTDTEPLHITMQGLGVSGESYESRCPDVHV